MPAANGRWSTGSWRGWRSRARTVSPTDRPRDCCMSSASILCAVRLPGCKRAGERLKSSGCVSTARCPGITGMPRRFARCAINRSLTKGCRRRQQASRGEEFGVFSKPVVAAVHADQKLDLVVVRRDILIPDGPVDAQAVPGLRLEVVGAVAQGHAPPVIGAAAQHPRSPPIEAPRIVFARAHIGLPGHAPTTVHRGIVEAEWLVRGTGRLEAAP